MCFAIFFLQFVCRLAAIDCNINCNVNNIKKWILERRSSCKRVYNWFQLPAVNYLQLNSSSSIKNTSEAIRYLLLHNVRCTRLYAHYSTLFSMSETVQVRGKNDRERVRFCRELRQFQTERKPRTHRHTNHKIFIRIQLTLSPSLSGYSTCFVLSWIGLSIVCIS